MNIAQDQHYEGEDWWTWSVWIEGAAEDLDSIDRVVWRLHPTFPQPVRELRNREEKFRLQTSGWGTFRVHAEVHAKGGGVRRMHHDLVLSYPGGGPAPV